MAKSRIRDGSTAHPIDEAITFENDEGSIAEDAEEKLVIELDKKQAAKLLVHLVKNLIK